MPRTTPDTLALATLFALTVVFARHFVNFSIPPFEDAAMLMRYAEHLAAGHGIVWNVGEPPVDGATDFLFMIAVALVRGTGLTVETAVRVLTIGAHFATVGLIYAGMRRVQGSGILPAFASAMYFAVGPGLFLSAAYFGTPGFALAVVVAWLLGQRLLLPSATGVAPAVTFSTACLIAGLVRPEGVLIAVFMLAAIGICVPARTFWRLTAVFAGVFLLLGGAYLLWRWQYFGHLLPNPFTKKGGGHLYVDGLVNSVRNSGSLAFPFIPAFLLAVRSRESLRLGAAFLIPIAGTVGMWVLLSDEMNFGARFQYPVLGLCALSWYPLVRGVPREYRLPSFASLTTRQTLALALVTAAAFGYVTRRQVLNSVRITYERDGRWDVGRMLSEYAHRRYTLATSEAGLLPLYSRWRAIDTWGLNDPWIAENGGVTDDYLARQRPDLIVIHDVPRLRSGTDPWFDQVTTLKRYAVRNGFTLAAAFGRRPDNAHHYYVRSNLPEHDQIVERIRSTRYVWFQDGQECTNYASTVRDSRVNGSAATMSITRRDARGTQSRERWRLVSRGNDARDSRGSAALARGGPPGKKQGSIVVTPNFLRLARAAGPGQPVADRRLIHSTFVSWCQQQA